MGSIVDKIEEYMNLHWTYHFEWSDEDHCYLASILELPQQPLTHGDTIDEALFMVKDALRSFISCYIYGNAEFEIPLPKV